MTRATSTNFNTILYSVALIFIFKKYLALTLKKAGHLGYRRYYNVQGVYFRFTQFRLGIYTLYIILLSILLSEYTTPIGPGRPLGSQGGWRAVASRGRSPLVKFIKCRECHNWNSAIFGTLGNFTVCQNSAFWSETWCYWIWMDLPDLNCGIWFLICHFYQGNWI